MKLVTYLGLVVRRVWAKKGILFGSLLGATLVTALLVVVPLYEASVQAVDLRFTMESASADDVDMTAFSTMNSYDAATGASNRLVVTDAQQRWLLPYYPTNEERSQTRELVVIPTGPGTGADWFGAAEQWQLQIEQFTAEAVPQEEWPQPPYPRPPQEATQVRIFTSPDLEQRVVAVEGEIPGPLLGLLPDDPSAPLPIAIGETVAQRTGFGVGDTFFLKPFSGLPTTFEYVEVAGIVVAADADDTIWGVDQPSAMVYLDQQTFDAWTGPIVIDPNEDPWERPQRGFVNTPVTQRWRMSLDTEAVRLEQLSELESVIGQFRAEVAKESGGTVPTNTFLPLLIDAFSIRSVVIGGPILAMLALVVGGAIYFLVYTAAMTVEREGNEIALFKSRGASSWQTVGIHLGQSLVVALVAAALAPFVSRFLVGMTGRIPPLSDLTGGGSLDVSQVRSVAPFLVTGVVITFVAMGVAVFPFARRGVLSLRALAARPGTLSVWQRYNLDLFAIALSLVILFQLSQRGFVNTTGEEVTLDPLAIVFPVLLLFAGALILLRLFPFLLRFVGWLMTKARGMSLALPGWHLGRNPVPYGRLALLVWVTTGLGAFALTYAATLQQSFSDRAAFVAGADVRIVAPEAGYLDVQETATGAAVLRTDGAPRQSGRRAEAIAMRPDEFASVVAWRDDFGAATPQEVFSPLRDNGTVPDVGVEIPVEATLVSVDGVVVPRDLREKAELGTTEPDTGHRLLIKVIDARGRVWTMAAEEDLTDAGWTTATIDLTTGLNSNYTSPPEPPLAIHSMWVERSERTSSLVVNGSSILLGEFYAVADDELTPLDLDEMSALNQLQVRSAVPGDTAARALYAAVPQGDPAPLEEAILASPLYAEGEVTMWATPDQRTRANTAVPQLRRIPEDLRVLLDSEAAAISGLNIGDQSSYSVGGQVFNGELVGFVDKVPTMLDGTKQGVMVLDLDALNAWLNGQATWSLAGNLSRIEAPQELWMAADNPDAAARRVVAQLPDGAEQVYTIEKTAASFTSRPVQVGLVAILFVGAATGVVLALAGVTGYVLLAVTRRAREMGVLRALGFERRGVGATFAIEQFVVIGLGAVIGTVGGIALVWVLIPFLQLGETAEVIEPEIVVTVPWAQLLGYIAIVGALLILSVVWATRRVSVRRMSEVLREVQH